jgi:hypothetical protein
MRNRSDADDDLHTYHRGLLHDVSCPRRLLLQTNKTQHPDLANRVSLTRPEPAMLRALLASTQQAHGEMLNMLKTQEAALQAELSNPSLAWVRQMATGTGMIQASLIYCYALWFMWVRFACISVNIT